MLSYLMIVSLMATIIVARSPINIDDLSPQQYLALTIAQALKTNKVSRQQSATALGIHVQATLAKIPEADSATIDDFINEARMHLSEIISITEEEYTKWLPMAEESGRLILERFTGEVLAADNQGSPMMQRLLTDLAQTLRENIDDTIELWQRTRPTYETDLEDILDEVRRLAAEYNDRYLFGQALRLLFAQTMQMLTSTMDGLHENCGLVIVNVGKRSFAIAKLIETCLNNGYL